MSWIIRFVEDMKVILEGRGCSINSAFEEMLPKMPIALLLKIREGLCDVIRILDLEQGRRQDAEQDAAEALRLVRLANVKGE